MRVYKNKLNFCGLSIPNAQVHEVLFSKISNVCAVLNLNEFWVKFTFSDLFQIGAIEWFVNSSMVKQFDMFLFVTCFKPLEHTKYEPTCEFEFELI